MVATVQSTANDAALRGFAGYAIKRALHTVQGDLNRALAPLGLRMLTFSALAIVADNPGLRQSHLADALAIERPNLVLVVDELERAGLVTRNPAPDDRRAHALRVTEKGKALYGRAVVAVQAHDDRMTQDLNEAEKSALISALRRIETAKGRGTGNG